MIGYEMGPFTGQGFYIDIGKVDKHESGKTANQIHVGCRYEVK